MKKIQDVTALLIITIVSLGILSLSWIVYYIHKVSPENTNASSISQTQLAIAANPSSLPPIRHVFIIVMENHDWSSITSSVAPYMWNTLIPIGAHANNYHNVPTSMGALHPSEPNYIWLEAATNIFSDHTFTTDNDASLTNSTNSTAHLATLLTASGFTWKSYQEGMPSNVCPIATGGSQYAAKHNPFVFFQDVSGNPPSTSNTYCRQHHSLITTSILQNDLNTGNVGNYNFITPNLCNDMHDCSVQTGDTWLSQIVPIILNSPTYQQDGLILITWDEGAGTGNNPIGMIALSPFAKQNYANAVAYSHASTVKTIEELFGLNPLVGHAVDPTTNDLADFFVTSIPTPTFTPTPTFSQNRVDVNRDGVVTIRDYNLYQKEQGILCAQISQPPFPTPTLPCADINCNGSVDIGDFNYIKQYYGMAVPTPNTEPYCSGQLP